MFQINLKLSGPIVGLIEFSASQPTQETCQRILSCCDSQWPTRDAWSRWRGRFRRRRWCGGGRGRRPAARERQGNEEIIKFLNFYKRKDSLVWPVYACILLKKTQLWWYYIADFVYSIQSVGGILPWNVMDIQLHLICKQMIWFGIFYGQYFNFEVLHFFLEIR